ncbi:MAG: hypothetical protein JNM63_05140, partial [Spirochaetia bacterium]|nr:hypothetical protein [Spirochaetia bacterium]
MKLNLGLKPFVLGILWLTGFAVGASTTPGFFRLSETGDFKRGQFQNTYLKENGALSLTPGCRKISDIEATIIWTVYENRDGLWIGTGHKGELYRVSGGKKIEAPISLNASEVLSIEEGPDGALYIGTAPKGVIYRLPRGSTTPEVFLILPESYVWDLASDGKLIYAATGSSGKIYRLDLATKKAEVFFTTSEDNVLEVRPTKNYVYASTGGRGYLYKIKSPKEFEILYDAGGRDINEFLFGEDGIILATSGKKLIAESSASSYASGSPENKTYYFQNEVIQVDDKGSFKSLFEIRNQTIPSIARQGENTILVGTGEEGEIYNLDLRTRRSSLLHKLPGNSIAAFTASKNNTHFVSGNGKALYQLETEYAKKGTYTTDVFDTRGTSIWGRVLFTTAAAPG